MDKETKKLIEIIKKLKWNETNLIKHTKEHPIKESKYNSLKWGNILGFYDITTNFEKTKNAYQEKSEEILSNLSNAIMYYHEGIYENKKYRSIGIFEDNHIKTNNEPLTIFIQNNKNKYFITTCYLRKIGFKERLYFAYELLKRPNQFKLNLSQKEFKNKIDIPQDFDFSNIEELTHNLSNDDLTLKAYNEYKEHGVLNSSTYQELFYHFINSFTDIKEIDKKIDLNNQVIKMLKKLYDQEILQLPVSRKPEDIKIPISELIEKQYNILRLKFNHKNQIDELKRKKKKSITSGIELLEEILDIFYKNNQCDIEKIQNIYNDLFENIQIYLSHTKINKDYLISWSEIYTCYEIKYLIEYLKEKNKNIRKEKNELKYQMDTDEENNFYLSIYKAFLNTHNDYKNKIKDYNFNYNEDVIELLDINKKSG